MKTEFGRRDWTRTNDPHHVKAGFKKCFPLVNFCFLHSIRNIFVELLSNLSKTSLDNYAELVGDIEIEPATTEVLGTKQLMQPKKKPGTIQNRALCVIVFSYQKLVGDIEFESTTSSMSRKRSNQLS